MSPRLRRITYKDARRCEEGRGARCQCRCGGRLHGMNRIDFQVNPFGLAGLSYTDPHRVPLESHPREGYKDQPLPFERTDP